jgi:ubiquinone biosynthesis protein
MANAVTNLYRLTKAGLVLAQHGVRFVPRGQKVPLPLRLAQIVTLPVRILSWPFQIGKDKATRISRALTSLGPSYIKLGQFMATRSDIIGAELAADLRNLQDRLPPFSMTEASQEIERALGAPTSQLFSQFDPPVAAASIAQVHKARVSSDGIEQDVAVKILRPNVEKRFRRDLDSFFFAARQIERFHPPTRRLKPVAVVDNLARTTELEMDLRLEAAALSEMAENIARRAEEENTIPDFRVPSVDWKRTAQRVLTTEWIDGIPISNHQALREAGHDLNELGQIVLRSFLTHAMHDGFFHADMHQGNLFVDKRGRLVAVDFGIMGRLGKKEQRYLAEILHGLITRDYRRAAEFHLQAGYVPAHHSVDVFAQALRAIGEPIQGRRADEISMADLLGQLFAYTEVFDMQTRPELILLQKSLVIVEGVARELNPNLNIWSAAEPVAEAWMEDNFGALGRLREAGTGATTIAKILADVPAMMIDAQAASQSLMTMAENGVRLDPETIDALATAQAKQDRKWRLRAIGGLVAISAAILAGLAWVTH